MTLEWIIERLKVSGQGTKQEVVNALENASTEELNELAVSCLRKVISPIIETIVEAVKNLDVETINEITEKGKEYGEYS